ncbi:MAG: hypothetical protein DRG30_01310 [Epsilonproteobacteria bacterium]|nr:MAG: hypothetical protein DRG30_01310 [Campylobacterota bacterium]
MYRGFIVSISIYFDYSNVLKIIRTYDGLNDYEAHITSCSFDDAQIVHLIVSIEIKIGDLIVWIIESPFKIR